MGSNSLSEESATDVALGVNTTFDWDDTDGGDGCDGKFGSAWYEGGPAMTNYVMMFAGANSRRMETLNDEAGPIRLICLMLVGHAQPSNCCLEMRAPSNCNVEMDSDPGLSSQLARQSNLIC